MFAHVSCQLHPFSCRNILVLEHWDNGVGMILHLCIYVQNELVAYLLNLDSSDGVVLDLHPGNFPQIPMMKDSMKLWSTLLLCIWQTMKTALLGVCFTTIVDTQSQRLSKERGCQERGNEKEGNKNIKDKYVLSFNTVHDLLLNKIIS